MAPHGVLLMMKTTGQPRNRVHAFATKLTCDIKI